MPTSAPRLSPRLVGTIEQASADTPASVADICRLAGAEAERLGLPRPSYEQVRRYVHMFRAHRRGRVPTLQLVYDATRGKPNPLLDRLSGID